MASSPNVEKAINKIYKADLESIRNLSKISKDLQKGGLTVAGDLRVKGKLKVDDDMDVKGKLNVNDDMNVKGKLKVDDDMDVKGNMAGRTMYIRKDVDVNNKDSNASLIIGNKNKNHIEIDGNEIQAKKNAKSPSTLHLNWEKGHVQIKDRLYVNGQLHAKNIFKCHGVSYFRNQKKGVWSHMNWQNGDIYLRGNVRIDGAGGTGNDLYVKDNNIKKLRSMFNCAGYAIDGYGSTHLLFLGKHNIEKIGWAKNRWDHIHLFRGYKIALFDWHNFKTRGGWSQWLTNRKSSNPKLFDLNKTSLGANEANSYIAKWIGY
jgi:cytoskeletal protein CcmA (bactofilin family)